MNMHVTHVKPYTYANVAWFKENRKRRGKKEEKKRENGELVKEKCRNF